LAHCPVLPAEIFGGAFSEWCLEPNPQKRPESALQISAALPGGDLLTEALRRGQTLGREVPTAPARCIQTIADLKAAVEDLIEGFSFTGVGTSRAARKSIPIAVVVLAVLAIAVAFWMLPRWPVLAKLVGRLSNEL
jgi:hypothetical protein